jgi:hypothetical protein
MSQTLSITTADIDTLSLTVVQSYLEPRLTSGLLLEQDLDLQFQLQYPLDDAAPQEYPDIPEVRLWFIRLDSVYPWLPYLLDWRSGELVRYAAMLVPHEFSKTEGIQFNPQALDLFLMQKVFLIHDWLEGQGLEKTAKLKQMAEVFGYTLSDELFNLL